MARANSGEMSDANSKIPTPTPLLRLFSQPQFLNRNFFFNLHHLRSPTIIGGVLVVKFAVLPPPSFSRSCSRVIETSETIQPRDVHTYSPSPPYTNSIYLLALFLISHPLHHTPNMPLLFSRHPLGRHTFSSTPFIPKRLDQLKARKRTIVAFLSGRFDSLSSILRSAPRIL